MRSILRQRKVLVVDDERHIARLVQVNLGRAGYQVVTAFDGKEALRQAEGEQPDLIALDPTLPDMDGFEVQRRLKENDKTRDIPVVMLTGKAQDAELFRT